jgi:hypothetical protein
VVIRTKSQKCKYFGPCPLSGVVSRNLALDLSISLYCVNTFTGLSSDTVQYGVPSPLLTTLRVSESSTEFMHVCISFVNVRVAKASHLLCGPNLTEQRFVIEIPSAGKVKSLLGLHSPTSPGANECEKAPHPRVCRVVNV